MRIKTPRCALFPPGFLLELLVSVSLFLFVLHFLTHVDLINFISSVISAFAGADYTLAYLSLQDSRVPKIEKRDNEKKKIGEETGERKGGATAFALGCGSCSEEKSPIVRFPYPNNNNTIERMTCHCFLQPIKRDLTSSSYTTPTLPLFPSHALIFTRHSYDLRAWNRLLHPRLIQPESGFILCIVLFN